MTKIYLIRHGETEDADARRYKGHIDVPLSERGIAQIKNVAEHLSRNTELACIYTSGLSRALKSAEIIADAFGLTPVINDGLKERSFGEWEGMTFDEIKEKWPEAFKAWAANPLEFSPMGGESTTALKARALKAFIEIVAANNGKNIAIVAHGGINRILLCELLGIPLENIFRIEQDFAALNVIELWDYPVVKHINYVV